MKNNLAWDSNDVGRAPDGTVYVLASEHIRGEPRMWWAETQRGQEISHPTDDWATTKAKAKQAAEHHYRSKLERAEQKTRESGSE